MDLYDVTKMGLAVISVSCLLASSSSAISRQQFAGVGMTASASSGSNDLAPAFAIDGNLSTRWSSNFSDREWWQVTFDEPVVLSGLRILWETAFAEKYAVKISDDGIHWVTVYDVEAGDGGPDILFFTPQEARMLRIDCRQRGTGWGHSIWDIRFFGPDEVLRAEASSSLPGNGPERAIDGRLDTAWRPEETWPANITMQLPESMHLGGLEMVWGDGFASEYAVYLSGEGENWHQVAAVRSGRGGEDLHYFPAAHASFVKVVIYNAPAGMTPALARLELKDAIEQATPIRSYNAKVRNVRPDLFPMWLGRQQEFWTVVGLPGEDKETLLSETGIIEPYKGSFSVQPMLWRDDHLFAWGDVDYEVGLVDGVLPLPWTRWQGQEWTLTVSAVMTGEEGDRWTAVRYRYDSQETAEKTSRLALAIRPVQLNPGWQRGGYSPIFSGGFEGSASGASVFAVEGSPKAFLLNQPTAAGAAPLPEGDIGEYLLRGEIPPSLSAGDAEGRVGAGVWFALDRKTDVVVLFPMNGQLDAPQAWADDSSGMFAETLERERMAWAERLAVPQIDIPEQKLIDVLRSNLAYIMINRDEPWFKPGPRNYSHAWIRDGVLTALATLRSGDIDMTKSFIAAFAAHIREDGWVPWMILETGYPVTYNPDPESGEGHEYDSQGQFPFVVRQYLDYSGDEEFAREMYPKVIASLRYADMLRGRRLTEEYRGTAYYGILPKSNSHEGYYPARHSYWDSFWLLRGIKDGLVLAERFGEENDATWLRDFEETYRRDLYASIMRVIEDAGLQNIPGCVELADFDPTSTTMAIMIADERDYMPQPYMKNTFSNYWEELALRIHDPDAAALYTPYEVRNVDVFVRLGWRDRALEALRYFIRDGVRPLEWNHMGEVVHACPQAPAYIGDMPHTWVGADYINAVRSMFAYEDGGRLVLAAGIDPAWAEERIAVTDLPTQFGPVSYDIRVRECRVAITLGGTAAPPDGFVISVPAEWRGLQFRINGEVKTEINGEIHHVSRIGNEE